MAGFWSSVGTAASNYFSTGSGWSDLLGGVMAGIGGAAAADRADDTASQGHEWALALGALKGDQDRRTSLFEKQLEDYYKQKDNYNKRVALDTYGQFSVQNRRSPGYTKPAAPVVPQMPSLESLADGS